MLAKNVNPQPITEEFLKQIEIESISKAYETVIADLEKDPASFENFESLKYLACNIRSLAEDYMNKVKKNLVTRSEYLVNIAEKFAKKRSVHGVILKAEKDKEFLHNEIIFDMLKKTLMDCQNSAYILAINRSQERLNSVQEQLLSGNNIIEQYTSRLPVMQQQLNLLLELAQAPRPHVPEIENVRQMDSSNTQPIIHPIHQITQFVAPANPTPQCPQNNHGPSWIIPQQQCEIWKNLHMESQKFLREYLKQLFNFCEFLEPSTQVSNVKKTEAIKIYQYFYGSDSNFEEEIFEKVMTGLRANKRQIVFKKIDNKSIGFGITNSGIEFYFKTPLGSEMECFSIEHCTFSSRLQTKSVGNWTVPESCGNFDFIILIEKSDRYAKFYKLFKDGIIIELKNKRKQTFCS